MAQKRMFSKRIIDSGSFLEMPLSAQCLYFHLNMRADDEGVIDNVKQIMRMIGSNDDDIKLLLAKGFLYIVEKEIVVIRDWWIHNTLKNDRFEKSLYHTQLTTTYSVGSDKKYTNNGNKMETNCFQNGTSVKYSIDKNSIDREREKKSGFQPPSLEDVKAYCAERKNKINASNFINFYESKGWMVGKNKMKDWKACIRTWEQREKGNSTNKRALDRDISNDEFYKSNF